MKHVEASAIIAKEYIEFDAEKSTHSAVLALYGQKENKKKATY